MKKFLSNSGATLKGLVKLLLKSRRSTNARMRRSSDSIVIMGNGPSLSDVISHHEDFLTKGDSMAVNFAAIAPEFARLKPASYILADPHFFIAPGEDANVDRLWESLRSVDWKMDLLVPVAERKAAQERVKGSGCNVFTFNFVGIEGFDWLRRIAYSKGWGMPRPRNVMIPAIMTAIVAGYKDIVLVGADHSWMKTLSVNDDNEVVSIQPHFYKEDGREEMRVRHEYRGYKLHQIVESFAIAFKSYNDIADYCAWKGVNVTNATEGSFIDAFPRVRLDRH